MPKQNYVFPCLLFISIISAISPPSAAIARDIYQDNIFEPRFKIKGQTQGAGTPNSVGLTAFVPFGIDDTSLYFFDVRAGISFPDLDNYSSIVNTMVDGFTPDLSMRLGHRWLGRGNHWVYGVHAGYDFRRMSTGGTDIGVSVANSRNVNFHQLAFGLEAVSEAWRFDAYGLVPFGNVNQRLNNVFFGGALQTYGLDIGYQFSPEWLGSVGAYYQTGDSRLVDSVGVRGTIKHRLSESLTASGTVSHDDAFGTRVMARLSFDIAAITQVSSRSSSTLNRAMMASPANREIRVHDKLGGIKIPKCVNFKGQKICNPQFIRMKKCGLFKFCIQVNILGKWENTGISLP